MRILKILALLVVLIVFAAVGFLYLLPEKATRLALQSKRKKANLVKKEIVLPSGLRYVFLAGGTGEPLMLLHGFGANKDNFLSVSQILTQRYHVICPDHIGFGESDHPENVSYGTAAQAERLRELVHALGFEAIHLGGSSMGGHIAMTYASLYPSEVRSLWLLDPAGVWSAPESDLAKIIRETGDNPLMARDEASFAKVFEFVMAKPPYIPPPMLNVLAQERIKNFSLEEKIFAELTTDPVEPHIKGLAVPALIVWGEQDRVLHVAGADILHKLMPNSEVLTMPGVGHLPMMESPQRSASDYMAFRDKLGK